MSDPATSPAAEPPEEPESPTSGRPPLVDVLGVGLLLGVVAMVVRGMSGPVTNTDIYFHLRFGAEFLHGWSLGAPGSVTPLATGDWVPTQWSLQILMAWVEDRAGLAGLAWYLALTSVLLVVVVYAVCRARAAPTAAALATALTVVAASGGLSGRPQVLSFALLALCTHAWLRARTTGRPPWWLIPVTWVWATAHGMWLLGIVVGLVAIAGIALDTRPGRRRLAALAAVPVGSMIAAGLTPLGPALYAGVVRVGAISDYFAEWAPPDFTDPRALFLAGCFAVTILVRSRQGIQDWTSTLLLLLAGAFAVYTLRTLPVAAVMLAPLLASALQSLTGERPAGARPPGRLPRWERIAVAGGATLALGVLAVITARGPEPLPEQPTWADPELASLPAGTVVANDWGWGGYLMWRHPHLALVAHGYGDAFTDAELQRNATLLRVGHGWHEHLVETGARHAYLTEDSALAYALEREPEWVVVRSSDGFVLLEREEPGPGD